MYVPQAQTSILVVDFSIDAIRILYIHKGTLQSIRLVPYGLAAMVKKIDQSGLDFSEKSLEGLLQHHEKSYEPSTGPDLAEQLVIDFAKQITMSLAFFQKQVKNFITPVKIICVGAGTQLKGFVDETNKQLQISVENLDIKKIAARKGIEINRKAKVDGSYSFAPILALAISNDSDVNFLSARQRSATARLFFQQFAAIVILSVGAIVGMYLYGNYQLKLWSVDYEKSKKQMITVIKDQMDIEIKNIKRVPDIVAAVQEKLEQTKKVCSSFDQTAQNNYLEHLNKLFDGIDRESIGLTLNKMSFAEKEILLQGKISSSENQSEPYTNLRIFTQKLNSLPGFTLKNIPSELTFNVTLEIKEDQHEQKD
jgi:hypothetical protein